MVLDVVCSSKCLCARRVRTRVTDLRELAKGHAKESFFRLIRASIENVKYTRMEQA